MSGEHPPPFDPNQHGLWRAVVHQDSLDTGQWNRARAERKFVGTCRLCGGHLKPLPSQEPGVSHIEWLEAECVLCHHPVVSPAGRVLRRSSRHTEMPPGWWDHRMRALEGAE